MSQSSKNPKRRRKLPKDITERPDDEVIEKLFGRRVLRELKKIAGKDAKDEGEDRPDSLSVEER